MKNQRGVKIRKRQNESKAGEDSKLSEDPKLSEDSGKKN